MNLAPIDIANYQKELAYVVSTLKRIKGLPRPQSELGQEQQDRMLNLLTLWHERLLRELPDDVHDDF